ncbi:hypothetical protein LTR86_010395 [Recurvomyces mirabilis]|nr:hypothetical protein LTR86_010395 [Recurvomyces mirabilis]
MVACRHTAWIEVSDAIHPSAERSQRSGSTNLRLNNPQRLEQLIETLRDPDNQYPQLIFLIGAKEKSHAIQQIFPESATTNRLGESGLANLHSDISSVHAEHPIFFVDSEANFPLPPRQPQKPRCHEFQPLGAKWKLNEDAEPNHLILTRLLFPFSDIICICADDIGGLEAAYAYLDVWSSYGDATTLPVAIRPRVSIVTSRPMCRASQLEEEQTIERLRQVRFCRLFSSIEILRMKSKSSRDTRYRPLQQSLLGGINVMRDQRRAAHVLFSATHLNWFFAQAVLHVSETFTKPFDFILTSRLARPLPRFCADQVRHLMELAVQHDLPTNALMTALASFVMLDAYPASAHAFAPKEVFSSLYEQPLSEGLETFASHQLPVNPKQQPGYATYLLDQILMQVSARFDCADRRGDWASRSHIERIQGIATPMCWNVLRSNRCCLLCLICPPEHVLPCGHAICDMCIQRFGQPQPHREYCYSFPLCILCQRKSDSRVFLKPPTAGVRVLSLDGGGSRGIIPLETLRCLQDSMGRDCRIQDFIDVAFGASAGGLIVLDLFARQSSVDDCIKTFSRFARPIFSQPVKGHKATLASFRSYMRLFLHDGLYSDKDIDASLCENFGISERLFDFRDNKTASPKIAVTATTTGDGSSIVPSNYNGILPLAPKGAHKAMKVYTHVRAKVPDEEPLLWKT